MGNKMTNLPTDVDSFLMDVAQMVEVEGQSIDYSTIQRFAEKATNDDIASLRANMIDLADIDFDFEDPEADEIMTRIFENIGVVVC